MAGAQKLAMADPQTHNDKLRRKLAAVAGLAAPFRTSSVLADQPT